METGSRRGDRPVAPAPLHLAMERTLLGIFALAVALSTALTPLARALARRTLYLDLPDEPRKLQQAPVPYGGGLSIMAAFATALFLAAWLLPGAEESLLERKALALFAGGAVIFLLGLLDDIFHLGKVHRLAVEAAVALLLWHFGFRITFLLHNAAFSLVATVLWIVLISNAFNLLDNMDGLSAGVAAISAGLLAAVAMQTEGLPQARLLVALAGAALGFLVYNFHPASIYLGDAGSLGLGYLLAALSIDVSYYHYREPTALALATPLVVLAIPIYDTLSVVYLRWRTGHPLLSGDRRHFSHRLCGLGMTVREAVLTIYLASFAMGLSALVLRSLSLAGGIVVLVQAALVFTIIALLERAGAKGEEK